MNWLLQIYYIALAIFIMCLAWLACRKKRDKAIWLIGIALIAFRVVV